MTSTRKSENGHRELDFLKQFGGLNVGYAAELLEDYETRPELVPAPDRPIVGADTPTAVAPHRPGAVPVDLIRAVRAVQSYVASIRNFGYRATNLDPLGMSNHAESLLDPRTHGVTDTILASPGSELIELLGEKYPLGIGSTAGDLISQLKQTYCGTIGYEYAHVRDPEEKAWLQQATETGIHRKFLTVEQKRSLLEMLTRAEVFEQFLHKAYPGQRWYSLEGCESMICLIDQVILQASYSGVRNILVGMAHRGRLNVLAHVFGKPYEDIIGEFSEGHFAHLASLEASGWLTDVKYHMGARAERDVNSDGMTDITLMLLPNPSHLEMVNPVVVGGVRGLQDKVSEYDREERAMGLLIHGDAAFAGQGVVAETFNLSNLSGYRTGGTIHVISNNQIGFTTEPHDGFSGEHASDLARGFDVPVIHVNADDIEACVAAAKLAVAYRQRFHKDFLIDLVGYRRFGHNENDEPSFTQPVMYRVIKDHPTTRDIWARKLDAENAVPLKEADQLVERTMEDLLKLKVEVDKQAGKGPNVQPDLGLSLNGSHGLEHAQSAVSLNVLKRINEQITRVPDGFTPHPTVTRLLARRAEALEEDGKLDWAHAEALALGSILNDGSPVRFTGQDVQRGTFSNRHAVVHDYETGEPWVALKGFGNANFWIYNSPLSEAGAVGFEHGYSVVRPDTLVIWEAQFGDFVNNAQSIVDEMIVSARAKWDQFSGLVMLLPHGYEGQGPNHSHAHLERFLALAAKDNVRVAYPTTAGQYFHLLRSQAAMLLDEPRPLIVMTGKSLLRHPLAAAEVPNLTRGRFEPVLRHEKPGQKASAVKRLVLCSGKVFVDVVTSPAYEKAKDVSILRFEELYPFPRENFAKEVARLKNVQEVIWLQEEPQNRGAWTFVRPLLLQVLGRETEIRYVGRPATPSPAEGANWLHKLQQNALIEKALGVS